MARVRRYDDSTESKEAKLEQDGATNTRSYTPEEKRVAANEYATKNKTNADEVKYKMAVNTARSNLKDKPNVSDAEFKSEIDKEFKNLGATRSGSDMRGDNLFTSALDKARGFIDDVVIGAPATALDWAFDNIIANTVGAFTGSKETADDMKGWFDAEDVKGVVDVAEDIGLGLLGPIGWGAVLGKNAIQQSGNLMEAATGKNRITLEDEDRLANAVEGIGGIALSAVPAIGKVKNLSKLTKEGKPTNLAIGTANPKVGQGPATLDEVDSFIKKARSPWRVNNIDTHIAENATKQKQIQKLLKKAEKAEKKAEKKAAKAGKGKAAEEVKAAENAAEVTEDVAAAAEGATEEAIGRVAEEATEGAAKNAVKEVAQEVPENIVETTRRAKLKEASKKALDSANPKFKSVAKNIGKGILGMGAGNTTAAAVNILPALARGDVDLDQIDQDELASIGISGLMSTLAMKGAVSPKGYKGLGALIPLAAMAANTGMKQADRVYDKHYNQNPMTDSEIMEALKVRR